MTLNRRRPPRWFVPAILIGATGAGGVLALLIAAAME